jgi:hypothetical protein
MNCVKLFPSLNGKLHRAAGTLLFVCRTLNGRQESHSRLPKGTLSVTHQIAERNAKRKTTEEGTEEQLAWQLAHYYWRSTTSIRTVQYDVRVTFAPKQFVKRKSSVRMSVQPNLFAINQ